MTSPTNHYYKLIGITFLFVFVALIFPGITNAATTYYVDCNGSDSANGTSQTTPWRTITKVNSGSFVAGDTILFKKGCTWTNQSLIAKWNGTATSNITFGAYGTGELPKFLSNTNGLHPVKVTGNYQTFDSLFLDATPPTFNNSCPGTRSKAVGDIRGFLIDTSSSYNTVKNSKIMHMSNGLDVRYLSHHNKILNNQFIDNNMMFRNDPGGDDDAGAFSVILHGDDNEVAYNTMSGAWACSWEYVDDGSAIEVYGGSRNKIHHNTSLNNETFAEMGSNPTGWDELYLFTHKNSSGATIQFMASDNEFYYNLATTGMFFVTRGAGGFGPVYRSKLYNNISYSTTAEGIYCDSFCDGTILSLKNNIIWHDGWMSIRTPGQRPDESNNIWWKSSGSPSIQGFTISSTSKVVNPQFENPSTNDFRIKSTSPGINTGTNESITRGYTTDYFNNIVGQSGVVDIGLHEFGATAQTTPTPTSSPISSPTPSPTQPPTGPYSIDDSIFGTGLNQFNYTGTWNHCAGLVCGTNYLEHYNGTSSWINLSGSAVTLQFTGSRIKYYSTVDAHHGIGAVSIDNGPETMIDLYRATRSSNFLVYTSPYVPYGNHTIKLRVTGNKNPASTNTVVVMDRIEIDPYNVADINKDTAVNLKDYNILVSQYNTSGTGLSADLNDSQSVNLADYNIFVTYYGM